MTTIIIGKRAHDQEWVLVVGPEAKRDEVRAVRNPRRGETRDRVYDELREYDRIAWRRKFNRTAEDWDSSSSSTEVSMTSSSSSSGGVTESSSSDTSSSSVVS